MGTEHDAMGMCRRAGRDGDCNRSSRGARVSDPFVAGRRSGAHVSSRATSSGAPRPTVCLRASVSGPRQTLPADASLRSKPRVVPSRRIMAGCMSAAATAPSTALAMRGSYPSGSRVPPAPILPVLHTLPFTLTPSPPHPSHPTPSRVARLLPFPLPPHRRTLQRPSQLHPRATSLNCRRCSVAGDGLQPPSFTCLSIEPPQRSAVGVGGGVAKARPALLIAGTEAGGVELLELPLKAGEARGVRRVM